MSSDQTLVEDPSTSTAGSASYNEVPYPGGAFPGSHPSHIAMVAKLCGLQPPPPSSARVLELGCSMGANLLPMAAAMPNAQFLGIDYSEKQVELAKRAMDAGGLTNAEVRCASILDVDDSYGTFDYIICHGVYSWVPEEVRAKILQIGSERLADNGVMYVSYNVYPGWHLKGLLRDMMLYHTAQFETPREKVAQARGLIDFLSKYAKTHSKAYTELLKEEAEQIGQRLDYYLYHDHLEEVNHPVYFHEFVDRLKEAGMSYLADVAIHTMMAQRFDETAAEMLRSAPLLRREQYMDFLRGRPFRSSLICRPSQVPNYEMNADRLNGMHVALKQRLVPKPMADGQTEWANRMGAFTSSEPITGVFQRMNASLPGWVAVSDLIANDENLPGKEKTVLDVLMLSFVRGLVDFAYDPPQVATEVGEKPSTTLYNRFRAGSGKSVPSLRHNEITLQPQQLWILQQLDGTLDEAGLASALFREVEGGRFRVTNKEGAAFQPSETQCNAIVKEELQRLQLMGMLTEPQAS